MKTILVTGGAGFIGSNFLNLYVPEKKYHFVNLDKLTYAGDLKNIEVSDYENYTFVEGDICDVSMLKELFENYKFEKVIHFAAESHVDNSITNPEIGKIYTHGAIENMTDVLREMVHFPETTRVTRETTKKELNGNLVLAPPSAHGGTWIRKMVPYVTASASGWMTFRGARRRRAIDKGFVMSDHCDWDGLLNSIEATGCEKVICTHGYTDIFSKYLREIGYDARTEATQYDGETDDSDL